MPNDNQTQAVNNSFWDKVEATPAAATGAAPSSAASAPTVATPVPASQSQTPAVSHSFWDTVEGKTPSTSQSGQTNKPQGDVIDRAVAGTSLEPINRGIQQGVAAGFGLKAPDPNHPDSLTFTDAIKQTWNNLKKGADKSYERLGGASDEELSTAPAYRVDVPLRSAAAILGTPFDMAASGIDGMASLLHEGGKEFISGIKSKDHETTARGFGKMLSSAAQIFAGAEVPEAVEGAANTLAKGTEYSPREVQGTKLTGEPRPANVLQGPINRSAGALGRDVRFGDPSKALVEEGITWPGTKGRLVQVNGKLGQLGGQLRAALQSAKGAIDLDSVLDPIIKKYKDKIRLSAEGDEIKAQAYKDLDVLRKTAAEHSPSGQATAAEANNVKQAIGDAVNWEKRPAATPMHDLTINAYREAYGQLKDSVNGMIGKDGAELNRRVSNLMAARNSLKELANQQKAGRATGIDVTKPTASIKDAVGHVAPAAIRGAQNVAAAAVPTATEATRVGALAEGNASQQNWLHVTLSDGRTVQVHPEDLQELQRRDPQAKVKSEQ